MSARIPPGFAEAWFKFTIASDPEPMYTSIGIDLASGVGANLTTTNLIISTAEDQFDDCISSSYVLNQGYVLYGNDGGDIRVDSTNTPTNGNLAATALPNNCAYLVKKTTGTGGRRGQGRMYVPGVLEGDVGVNGEINSSPFSTYAGNFNSLFTNLVALADVEALCLLHSSSPFTPTTITGLALQTKIATQRRRMRK